MTKNRLIAGGAAVVVAVVYLLGYWPERQKRVALEAELSSLRQDVVELTARDNVSGILGQLLAAIDEAAAMNYGQAQTSASSFFDAVRREASVTSVAPFRSALESVLQRRDAVTSALARGEASVLDPLRQSATELRRALGYPVR